MQKIDNPARGSLLTNETGYLCFYRAPARGEGSSASEFEHGELPQFSPFLESPFHHPLSYLEKALLGVYNHPADFPWNHTIPHIHTIQPQDIPPAQDALS